MEIYGEYLFLENFITGILLLLLTGRLLGETPAKKRLLTGGLLCGMSGFLLLFPMQGMVSVGIRLAVSIIITWTAFGGSSIGAILKKTCLFLGFTFLSGGAAMAWLLWQQIPALSGSGILYVQLYTYGKLICAGLLAFALADGFVHLVQDIRMERIAKGRLKVFLEGQVFEMSAVLDTGNYLKEPISGRPVILVDKAGAEKLPSREREEVKSRMTVIPYHAVGTEHGILLGFRSDKAVFRGRQMTGAVIGFYEGRFQEAEAIVNREVLNCGIIENERGKEKHGSVGEHERAGIYQKAGRKVLRGLGRFSHRKKFRRDFLHRRKRCAAAAPVTCGRGENAGSLCSGQPGCQKCSD